MSFHHTVPCVMTNTNEFFVRICGCGVVHMSFGCNVVNVSPEATIAISETLKEVVTELRKRLPSKAEVSIQSSPDNVIPGKFPISHSSNS